MKQAYGYSSQRFGLCLSEQINMTAKQTLPDVIIKDIKLPQLVSTKLNLK